MLTPTLLAARSLIAEPENWHKGALAAPNATCFCAVGAVVEALQPGMIQPNPDPEAIAPRVQDGYDKLYQSKSFRELVGALAVTVNPNVRSDITDPDTPMTTTGLVRLVATFNDAETTTHAQVLDLFDQTIARED